MGKRYEKQRKKEVAKYRSIIGDRKTFEMTEEEKKAPITKEIGELCRHRLEKRWYRRMILLNFAMIITVITLCITKFDDYYDFGVRYMKQYEEKVEEDTIEDKSADDNIDQAKSSENSNATADDSDTAEKKEVEEKPEKLTEDDIPLGLKGLFYGVAILIFGYIALYIIYAQYRSNSVRITENNFPEVYQTIEEYANRLGMTTPKAYVMQSSGVLNAFSTFLFKKQWIQINSELFEIAYREYQDMDALNFVIAHELAHIYYGHATLHYNIWIWFSRFVPVFNEIASRTREYSCDRLAQRLTGTDGIEAMLALVVDRHLYKMVDKEDYLNEMRAQKGFFIWLVNMLVDHPIMSKRVIALEEGVGSGKLY